MLNVQIDGFAKCVNGDKISFLGDSAVIRKPTHTYTVDIHSALIHLREVSKVRSLSDGDLNESECHWWVTLNGSHTDVNNVNEANAFVKYYFFYS